MFETVRVQGRDFSVTGRVVRLLCLRDEFVDDFGDPRDTLAEIQHAGLRADLVTFLQLPPAVEPKFDYYMEWDNIATLAITTYEEWFHKQVHQNIRNKIRKAEKAGVVVRKESFSDELAFHLVDLFNETPIRRGRPYPYYGWSFEEVIEGWATDLDRSTFLTAYLGEELIGFVKLIRGHQLMRTSGTVAKVAHRKHAPMNILISKAVETCAAEGVRFLLYGHFTYGRQEEDSLASFKKYNGFEKVDVPRYYAPLSRRGEYALRLRLHRGLAPHIPTPVLQTLLSLRSKWYAATTGLRAT